jgi:hypothetical protein
LVLKKSGGSLDPPPPQFFTSASPFPFQLEYEDIYSIVVLNQDEEKNVIFPFPDEHIPEQVEYRCAFVAILLRRRAYFNARSDKIFEIFRHCAEIVNSSYLINDNVRINLSRFSCQ